MGVLITQTKADGRRVANRDTHVAENLYVRHYKIIQLHMTGMKDIDVARQLNITPQTVQNTLASPIVRSIVQRMIEDQNMDVLDSVKRFKELMPVALQVAEDILTAKDASYGVKAKVAMGIMDRNGFGPVTRNFTSTAIYNGDAAINFRERAKAAGIVVEEAEVVEDKEVSVFNSDFMEELRRVET